MKSRVKFTLRSLFVVLTCAAFLFAYHVHTSKIRREGTSAVIDSGGQVTSIDSGVANWLRNLVGQEYFERVERVDGLDSRMTDSHLDSISRLSEIRHILTNHSKLGSVYLAVSISSADNMDDSPLITDHGLMHVSRLKNLESLVLFNTDVTDKGIAYLTNLKKLQYLKISSTRITDASIPDLEKLRSLKQFWISGTDNSTSGVEQLKHALQNCQIITDDDDSGTFYAL